MDDNNKNIHLFMSIETLNFFLLIFKVELETSVFIWARFWAPIWAFFTDSL